MCWQSSKLVGFPRQCNVFKTMLRVVRQEIPHMRGRVQQFLFQHIGENKDNFPLFQAFEQGFCGDGKFLVEVSADYRGVYVYSCRHDGWSLAVKMSFFLNLASFSEMEKGGWKRLDWVMATGAYCALCLDRSSWSWRGIFRVTIPALGLSLFLKKQSRSAAQANGL
jgi:hypothetical protein